jgi:excisionase family DNA binding protein
MRTIHLEPGRPEAIAAVLLEIEQLLAEGKDLAVSVAQQGEWLAPMEVAERLGCSRQQVEWLIRTEELEAYLLGHGWQVSLDSVLALEARRENCLRRLNALADCARRLRAVS